MNEFCLVHEKFDKYEESNYQCPSYSVQCMRGYTYEAYLPISNLIQCERGYEYEEWRLFQNLTRVVQHTLLEKAEGKEVNLMIQISLKLNPDLDFQVACCNAFDGLLVLGTDQGELLIYQQMEVYIAQYPIPHLVSLGSKGLIFMII